MHHRGFDCLARDCVNDKTRRGHEAVTRPLRGVVLIPVYCIENYNVLATGTARSILVRPPTLHFAAAARPWLWTFISASRLHRVRKLIPRSCAARFRSLLTLLSVARVYSLSISSIARPTSNRTPAPLAMGRTGMEA